MRKGAGTRLVTTSDTFQQCTLYTPVDGVPEGTSSCLSSASRAQCLLTHLRTPQKPVLRAGLHLVFGDYWSLLYMLPHSLPYATLCQEPTSPSSPTLAARFWVGRGLLSTLACGWQWSESEPRAANVTHLDGLDRTHRLEESSFHQQPRRKNMFHSGGRHRLAGRLADGWVQQPPSSCQPRACILCRWLRHCKMNGPDM